MRVLICEPSGDTYDWIGTDAVAIWPDELDMSPGNVEIVADHWQGETLSAEQVARMCGH